MNLFLDNLLSICGHFSMQLNHWSVWKHITFANKAVNAKKYRLNLLGDVVRNARKDDAFLTETAASDVIKLNGATRPLYLSEQAGLISIFKC